MTILTQIKEEFLYQLEHYPLNEVKQISFMMTENKYNVHIGGVGKSGNIAKHLSDLLKSLSLKVFFFDTLNITHGDLGSLQENDIILMFSNSGNTMELIDIIPLMITKKCKVVGICCNENSKFKQLCHKTIILPLKNELNNSIPIPTNSVMCQLIFCNILSSFISHNVSQNEYQLNHSSGNISIMIKPISYIIILGIKKVTLQVLK